MWEALQFSRTVSLLEVLLVLLAGIGIPMHLWGWHDALLDEGAILAGARNTPAGALLLEEHGGPERETDQQRGADDRRPDRGQTGPRHGQIHSAF